MGRRIDLDTTRAPGEPGQLVVDGVDCSDLTLDWAADARIRMHESTFYGFYLDGRRLYGVDIYRNGEFFRAVPERDDGVEDLYRLLEAFWPRDRLADV